jgi:S-adenosylmethionine:tRNA ribosyltransferase-isomerase
MIAADQPVQRPPDARLLVVDSARSVHELPRAGFVDLLRPHDIVVANDAATLPASLQGTHGATGRPIEVRLAARSTLDVGSVADFVAVVFGVGDFRTRTENRPLPPLLTAGDRLSLGPLQATVTAVLDHPRLVTLHFQHTAHEIWAGIAHHGRPIQYAHLATPLMLWDVWSPIAGRPVAFEPPSAGFALDWKVIARLRARGIAFTTITHAAGISSTGDLELDRRLPFDEPYEISDAAAHAVERARRARGRVIAIGTTVVRALEHAAAADGTLKAGGGIADQRIGAGTRLKIIGAILTGAHEHGTSHHDLLRAFVDDDALDEVDAWLDRYRYRTHEFGDSVFIERNRRPLL